MVEPSGPLDDAWCQAICQACHAAPDLPALDALRVAVLGKQGQMTQALRQLGACHDPVERKQRGTWLHAARRAITEALSSRKAALQQQALSRAQTRVDVSLPGRLGTAGRVHPITQAIRALVSCVSQWGFSVVSGPEVETEHYNFNALNTPAFHPARAMQDTFYCGDGRLLRTQTSTMQIHTLETQAPPLRIVAPGRVYRRDSDPTHSPMFHQLEGLVVDQHVTFAGLQSLVRALLSFWFGKGPSVRFRASYFPFTEPSAEVDVTCVLCQGQGCRVCKDTGWLEIMGCGMVHPAVLEGVDLDPERYRGCAFGVGIERLVMLRYGLSDLRALFDNDRRMARQF